MSCVQKEELPLTWCSRGDMACVQKEELLFTGTEVVGI